MASCEDNKFLNSLYCEQPDMCEGMKSCWRAALIDQQLLLARNGQPHALERAINTECDHEQLLNLREQALAYIKNK